MATTTLRWNDLNVAEEGYRIYHSSAVGGVPVSPLPSQVADIAASTNTWLDPNNKELGLINNYRIAPIFGGKVHADWVSENLKTVPGDFDWYVDFTNGRTFEKVTQSSPAITSMVLPANTVGGYEFDSNGNPILMAANSIGVTDLGLHTNVTRTNLIANSASWGTLGIAAGSTAPTKAVNQGLSPINDNTAMVFGRNVTTSTYSGVSMTKTATEENYTFSCFVKRKTARYVSIRLQGNYPARADFTYDIDTNTFVRTTSTTGFTNLKVYSEYVANGWWRIAVTTNSNTDTSIAVFISCCETNGQIDSVDTSSTVDVYLWGFQLENADAMGSYIHTTGSTVQRGGGAYVNFPSGSLLNGVMGFITIDQKDFGQFSNILRFSDTSTNNSCGIEYGSGGGMRMFSTISGSNTISGNGALRIPRLCTIVFAFFDNNLMFREVGQAGLVNSSTMLIAKNLNRMGIGFSGIGSGTSSAIRSQVKRIGLIYGSASRPINQTLLDALHDNIGLESSMTAPVPL